MRPLDHWQSNPARSEDAPKLTVRKERDLSVQVPKTGDESIGPVGNSPGCFTPGATVSENIPIGPDLADVHGAPTFVITVVPFSEVRLDFGAPTQGNQCTGPLSPSARATEHMGEFGVAQSLPKLSCFLFAMFGQRNVGASRMLVGHRPGGFTVPNKIEV